MTIRLGRGRVKPDFFWRAFSASPHQTAPLPSITPPPVKVTSVKSLPLMNGMKSPPLLAVSQSPGTFMKSI